MLFSEINQIRREFGINEQNTEDIRYRLRELQSQLHPDRTGGEFQGDNTKEKFLRVSAALDYLEEHENRENSLVPVSVMTDLVKVMRDLVPAQQEKNAEAALNSSVTTKLATLHTRFRTPRITTSAISIVLSAIWLFPNQIIDHPILGQYLDPHRTIFSIFWIFSILLTVMMWILTSMQEEKRRQFLGLIKTERWQNERLMRFIKDINFDEDDKKRFTKDSFVQDLMWQHRSYYPFLRKIISQRQYELDPELAQGIADIVINRALERGLIIKDSLKTLSDTYCVI